LLIFQDLFGRSINLLESEEEEMLLFRSLKIEEFVVVGVKLLFGVFVVVVVVEGFKI